MSYHLSLIHDGFHSRKGGQAAYSRLEWSTNETLQLQRMAHEGTGTGDWFRGTKPVPVTQPGSLLAVLDIADPAHPRLQSAVSMRSGDSDEDQPSDGSFKDEEKSEGGFNGPFNTLKIKEGVTEIKGAE